MNFKLAGLALLLGVTGLGVPAKAGGDVIRVGSYKDYGSAVPVPAPIPIPVYAAQWYLRLDAGVGFGASPSVSASGEPFGLSSEVEDPFGFSPAWFNKDFDTFFTAGGGVGYRWNPYFRTDLTIDYHSSGDADIKGSRVFQVTEGPDSWSRVTVNDRTSLNSAVFLFNGYVDFTPWRGITPYVGAGVGFAINSIDRRHDSTLQACDDEACADPGVGAETHTQRNTNDVTFAAALMAGITYEITPITSLDINYRFLHIGGSDLSLGINGAPTKVSIGDFNEHQIRAGLRFNVF